MTLCRYPIEQVRIGFAILLTLCSSLGYADIERYWGIFGARTPSTPMLRANGTQLATFEGNTIKYWDRATGNYLRANGAYLTGFSYLDPNDQFTWRWLSPTSITRTEISTGIETARTIPPSNGLVFSNDGERVYTVKSQSPYQVSAIRTSDGSLIYSRAAPTVGSEILLSPDEQMFGVKSVARNGVEVFRADTGEFIRSVPTPLQTGLPLVYQFRPFGNSLAFLRSDGINLISTQTGLLVRSFNPILAPISCFAFSPDGSTIALGYRVPSNGESVKIILMDVDTGAIVREISNRGRMISLTYLDGQTLVGMKELLDINTGLWNPQPAEIYRVGTGEFLGEFPRSGVSYRSLYIDESRDRLLAITAGRAITSYDTATGDLIGDIATPFQPRDVKFSPDKSFFAVGTGSSFTYIYNAALSSIQSTITHFSFFSDKVAISPDGTKLVGAHSAEVRMWDIQTGLQRWSSIIPEGGGLLSVDFSPDGSSVNVFNWNGSFIPYSSENGSRGQRISDPRSTASSQFVLNSLRTKAVSVTGGQLVVWDMIQKVVERVVTTPLSLRSGAFSPNGKYFVTSSSGSFSGLTFWDSANWNQLGTFRKECLPFITEVTLSEDSKNIYAARFDNSLIKFANPMAPLSGIVTFRDSQNTSGVVPHFELMNSNGELVASWDFGLQDGRFSIQPPFGLKSGQYRLRARGGTWLSQTKALTVPETEELFFDLTNGDCNSDNVIDLTDYTILAFAFNSLIGGTHWDASADLNRDGVVDLTDYTIIAINFNAIGD